VIEESCSCICERTIHLTCLTARKARDGQWTRIYARLSHGRADKLTPSSKKKKRRPYTPESIAALRQRTDLDDPLGAAVFAYDASARLGEFTVRTLRANPKIPNTHNLLLLRPGICLVMTAMVTK
jgi:hypothetical protein